MNPTVEERITALEAANRRYRVTFYSVAVVGVCVCAMAAKAPLAELLEAKQIKTEKLTIAGPDGKTYAEFGIVQTDRALVFYDADGKPRLLMGTDPGPGRAEIGLKILDSDGKEVFFSGQRIDGRCEVSGLPPAEKQRIEGLR
jgi:hypothetical protein